MFLINQYIVHTFILLYTIGESLSWNPIQFGLTVSWNIKIISNRICNFLTNPKTCFLTTFFIKREIWVEKSFIYLWKVTREKRIEKKSRALLHLIAFQNLSETGENVDEIVQIVYISKKSKRNIEQLFCKTSKYCQKQQQKELIITNVMFVSLFHHRWTVLW